MNIHWRFSFGLALLALSAMGGLSWSLQYSPRTSLRDHWRAELLNDDSDKRLLLGQLAELTPPDIATLVKYAGSADPLLADHSQRLLNELVVKFQHHSSEYQENNLSTLIHEIKKQYASTKATSHPFFYNLVFQLLEDSTLNETKSQKNFLADCRSILEMYGKDPYPKEHLVASHQELDPVRRLTELQELINELERQSHLAGGQLGIEPVTPKSPFEIVTPIISENEMKEQTIFK
ncbi:MAG: hypothetical protein MPJ24_03575, partial [Pirellulaceae bacterium]|nr:hypothetical protein [Pirellulaceae bacterium]